MRKKIVLIYLYTQHCQKNMCISQLNWANSFAFSLFIPLGRCALEEEPSFYARLWCTYLNIVQKHLSRQIKKKNEERSYNRLSKCYFSNQIIAACVPLGCFYRRGHWPVPHMLKIYLNRKRVTHLFLCVSNERHTFSFAVLKRVLQLYQVKSGEWRKWWQQMSSKFH